MTVPFVIRYGVGEEITDGVPNLVAAVALLMALALLVVLLTGLALLVVLLTGFASLRRR